MQVKKGTLHMYLFQGTVQLLAQTRVSSRTSLCFPLGADSVEHIHRDKPKTGWDLKRLFGLKLSL